ncbi:MAG TPA: hypothetical protein VMP68_24135 [Candidatus Eisenbacteria bacterium]|nr:hypothetical protein [Candidatus Eisenbacteria bacterium]
MIREHEIKEKIAQAINRQISIVDLARWFYSNSWNMHKDSSPSAVALASDVHLLLAERDDFSISDAEFISGLQALNIDDTQLIEVDVPQPAFYLKSAPALLVPVSV